MTEYALRSLDDAVNRSSSLLKAFEDADVKQQPLSQSAIDMRGFCDAACVPGEDLGNFLAALLLNKMETKRAASAAPIVNTARESPGSAEQSGLRKIPTHFFRKFREAKQSFDFRNL